MKIFFLLICSTQFLMAQEIKRKDLSLTIYNQNLAFIKDLRTVNIKEGTNNISFSEIASSLIPESVKVKSIKNNLNILEQNYEYDLINSNKMLEKFIDKEIKIITKDSNLYSGQLLSFDMEQILLKNDNDKVNMISRENIKDIEFIKIPENFRTKPTLTWLLKSNKDIKDEIEVSYLTNNISWKADYVITLLENDKKIDINSWVTIKNNSGTDYKNAKLKLMAGELNIVKTESLYKGLTRAMNKELDTLTENDGGFKEKSFFEYHIYDLNRIIDIKNNQDKQISLFNVQDINVEKIYTYDGAIYSWYFYDNWSNQSSNKDVNVKIKFKNSKENNLAIPFPKGKIRIYKKDNSSTEFIGEDEINHTPKDEFIELNIGKAFDIKGERKIINHQKISNNIYKDTYEIKIKNHKDEDINIIIKEKQWGDWKITDNNVNFIKKDKNNIEFPVKVKKNSDFVLKYIAEYTF